MDARITIITQRLSLGMDLSNKTIRFLNNSPIGKKNHESFQYSCRTKTWYEVAYTPKQFHSVPLGNKTAWYLASAGEVGALGKILISPPVLVPFLPCVFFFLGLKLPQACLACPSWSSSSNLTSYLHILLLLPCDLSLVSSGDTERLKIVRKTLENHWRRSLGKTDTGFLKWFIYARLPAAISLYTNQAWPEVT